MPHRPIRLAPIVGLLLGCSWPVAIAGAAPPEPGTIEDPNASSTPVLDGQCTVEPSAQGQFLIFLPSPDRWNAVYFPVGPGDCPMCPPPRMIHLNSITLRTRTFSPCTYQVEVAVVAATGGACSAPDDQTVLCGPVVRDITGPTAFSFLATLALPFDCCVGQDAFVRVRFLNPEICDAPITVPLLNNAAGACAPCTQYFTSLVSFPAITDFCVLTPDYNLWYSVDADCCGPTPARPRTWGRVKQLYR
jgi:hypothetical protein